MIEGPHQVSKSKVNLIREGRTQIKNSICFFDIVEASWKVHKPSWQAFWHPLEEEIVHLDVDKKVPQTIRASVYTPSPPQTGNAHMEATHFKQGLPYLRHFPRLPPMSIIFINPDWYHHHHIWEWRPRWCLVPICNQIKLSWLPTVDCW